MMKTRGIFSIKKMEFLKINTWQIFAQTLLMWYSFSIIYDFIEQIFTEYTINCVPSIILDFVFIIVNPINMVPVFKNFTNKHTKKYYDEGEKQQVLQENTRGPILGQGGVRKG